MNLQRVTKVLETLRNPLQPEEVFDMDCYIEEDRCRTGACAYGLYFLRHPEENPPGTWKPYDRGRFLDVEPEEMANHFGISDRECREIFQPGAYDWEPRRITPRMVIERLEALIRGIV